jgi:hypothetical protein
MLALVTLACVHQLAKGAVTKAWVLHYANVVSNSHDVAAAVLRDAAGNVVVAGYTHDGAGSGLVLLKYSASGSPIWQRRHDGVDLISAAALDTQGNIAVAGFSSNAQDWDFFTAKYSAEGVLLWSRKYDGPSDDKALGVAFDASGNVVVTGGSSQDDYRNDDDDLTNYDYYTAKYAAADGAILWERRYNGPGNRRDLAQAVTIDASNNVVVTGTSFNDDATDFYTVKYAGTDGGLLWEQRYHGGGEHRSQTVTLALDAAGNAVVAGSSISSSNWNRDAHTIKYAAADGALLWERRYDGPAHFEDAIQAVAVDGNGNVVVTGLSVDSQYYQDAYTAKYAGTDGAMLWERTYSPTNRSAAGQNLAVDASGNVVMTGYSISNIWDHYTAKYAAADGALLWERLQDGPRIPGGLAVVVLDTSGNAIVAGSAGGYDSDVFTAQYAATDGSVVWKQLYAGLSRAQGVGECVAVDASSNVIVSGSCEGNDSEFDYYTAKYSPQGALLWERRYDSPGHGGDYVKAMAVDADGNVAVTGYSQGARAFDFYTVKYAASNGAVLWEKRYDGTGGWDDHPQALAVDGNGNVIVTGFSTGTNVYGPYTAKYAAATGALLWEKHANFAGGIGGQAAVTVDGGGNVLVTGHHTVKYAAANGAVLWSRDFIGEGIGVKADANGNVLVTGHAQGYYTAKYAAADGAVLWEKSHISPAGVAYPSALAVDAQGNAIVTGGSYDLDSSGIQTLKYASADGAILWERRYDTGPNSASNAKAVAVDESGNVVVAGYAHNGLNHDYFAAKYAAADGAVLWEQLYNGPTGGEDRVENRCSLALGPNGMVAITGVADGYGGSVWGHGLTTVIYREGLEPISIALVPTGLRLRFTGEAGRRYTIQRASAITGPWETIATPQALANGQVEHLDSASLPGSVFYRARTPE